MEALSEQPVSDVIEVDQFVTGGSQTRAGQAFPHSSATVETQNDLNRIYMSYRLVFCVETFCSLEYSSGIAEISGDPDLTDDSMFDDHDMLLSLLQGVVSLKMSVVVKPNSDLSSEAFTDESGEDEVLLLHTNTCLNGQIQSTVDSVGEMNPSTTYGRRFSRI